jgi:hypothetical protein
VRAQAPPGELTTPESYLGSDRAERFVNGVITSGRKDFGAHAPTPPTNELSYGGNWQISSSSATAGAGAELKLGFFARRVFLVLGSPNRARNVRVLLDGRPIPAADAGSDVSAGAARVRAQRLYTLVDLPQPATHVLTLLPDAGVTGYAFTFG